MARNVGKPSRSIFIPIVVKPKYCRLKQIGSKKTEGKIIYFAPEPVRSTDFDANDLFDAPSPFAEQSDPESYLLAETKRYDQLLYLLSAKGEGSTETFGNYCATLWTSEADKNRVPKPAHVLRRLNLMGHLAIHPDGKQWRMLPPLLVCCHHDGAAGEDEKAAYTLVGKRDHSLICFLRDHADLESLPQERGDGPATQLVRLRLEGRDQIAARGVDFCDDYSACVHQSLPDFATWRKTLPSFTVPALCEYDPRLYDGDAFVRGAFTQTTGFYELWTLPQNETDTGKVWRTAFYEAGEQRWLSGDWYGLRYLSHSLRHGSGTMVHRTHEDGCEIVCSEAGRFPLPFERALVVASGRLPFRRKTERGGARLVYPDVPCSIAALVADKLSISLIK